MRRLHFFLLLPLVLAGCAPALRSTETQDTRTFPTTCFSALSLLGDLAPATRPAADWTPYATRRLTRDGLTLETRRSSSVSATSVVTCQQTSDVNASVTIRTTGLSAATARQAHQMLFDRLSRQLEPASGVREPFV